MELIKEPKVKPAFYFPSPDQEILDDRILALSCDEETWLYKIDVTKFNGQFEHYQLGSPFQDQQSPSSSGSVDTRTFTRRKHCSLRPSLESVVESPLSNRSSLGLLGASKLLNDSLQVLFTQNPTSENLGKSSSSSTGSEKKPFPQRVFKLDSPFTNTSALGINQFGSSNFSSGRFRGDSESSDISIPNSIENFSPFEKNDRLTDSMVSYLEKQEVSCRPPTEFQDEDQMTNSILSLPENPEITNGLGVHENTEPMVDFLMPVNCKPPSGFDDNCTTNSFVHPLRKGAPSSESENIPPYSCGNRSQSAVSSLEGTAKSKASGDGRVKEINTTFEIKRDCDASLDSSNESDEMTNLKFTNNVNIARKRRDNGDIEDDLNLTRTLRTNLEKESCLGDSEKGFKLKALNNRDLNVSRELNGEEIHDFNSKTVTKEFLPNKLNSALSQNNTKRNGTFTKSEISEALNFSRQTPPRNSTFNTTFTKLEFQPESDNLKKFQSRDVRSVNSKYNSSTEMLNGGVEDDQTSSASDSSFSSGSTKPRSVDELRTIAQQQESSLAQHTSSTPVQSYRKSPHVGGRLSIELSPITRAPSRASPLEKKNNESRSANCSPIRNQCEQVSLHSRLQQASMESRRLTLQASSLSNIARPRVSGMRVPQPVSRFTAPQRPGVRPATAPTPAPGPPLTGIPRPQASRLPMPRFRGSGIPSLKRGGGH